MAAPIVTPTTPELDADAIFGQPATTPAATTPAATTPAPAADAAAPAATPPSDAIKTQVQGLLAQLKTIAAPETADKEAAKTAFKVALNIATANLENDQLIELLKQKEEENAKRNLYQILKENQLNGDVDAKLTSQQKVALESGSDFIPKGYAAEYDASKPEDIGATLARMDASGDGFVSKEEYDAAVARVGGIEKLKEMMDKQAGNGDGTLSDEEIGNALAKSQQYGLDRNAKVDVSQLSDKESAIAQFKATVGMATNVAGLPEGGSNLPQSARGIPIQLA
ncbi:MAG: hypothetical protein SFX19_04760 [Alphaproteobacteria bacterium]|nr:hypothetical protein [Alphaproteobacteria bacterium]